MYSLPSKLKEELYKEFSFDKELNTEEALLHKWQGLRYFICPLPPFRQGLGELLIDKAFKSQAECPLIVVMLPCDTSTQWFHKVWEDYQASASIVQIRFFKGRVKYEGGQDDESRFTNRTPSCLVIFHS